MKYLGLYESIKTSRFSIAAADNIIGATATTPARIPIFLPKNSEDQTAKETLQIGYNQTRH